MARRDDEELRTLLDDLEGTLAELRAELDGREEAEREEVAPRRSATRRRGPPTPGEMLRFTEEYTIPTVIATLEATIRALELLREAVGLLAPPDAEATERGRRPLDAAGRGAAVGTERALDRLRTALAQADLPSDPAARELVEEARSLSEAVERHLAEAEGMEAGGRGVGIEVREETGKDQSDSDGRDVTEEDTKGDVKGEDGSGENGTDGNAVDVEAELESIRDELDERQDET